MQYRWKKLHEFLLLPNLTISNIRLWLLFFITNCTQFLTTPKWVKLNFLQTFNCLFLNIFYVSGVDIIFIVHLRTKFYFSNSNILFVISHKSRTIKNFNTFHLLWVYFLYTFYLDQSCMPIQHISLYWTSGLWIRWRQFRSLLTVLNVCHSVVTDCKIITAAWLGYPSTARNFHTNFRENSTLIAIVEMEELTQRERMVIS